MLDRLDKNILLTPKEYEDFKNIPIKRLSTFSGKYNELTGKPFIPSATSHLTNDSGFIRMKELNDKTIELNNSINEIKDNFVRLWNTENRPNFSFRFLNSLKLREDEFNNFVIKRGIL
jgi:hypothetical protein